MTEKTPDPAAKPADAATTLRQGAAEQLSAQLQLGTALIAQCDAWAKAGKPGRLASVATAARVMLASAGVARALTLAALGETRHRSINEAPSPVDRAREQRRDFYQGNLDKAKKAEGIYERLNELVENSVRARMGEPDAEDRIKRNLDHSRENAERLTKILAEDD